MSKRESHIGLRHGACTYLTCTCCRSWSLSAAEAFCLHSPLMSWCTRPRLRQGLVWPHCPLSFAGFTYVELRSPFVSDAFCRCLLFFIFTSVLLYFSLLISSRLASYRCSQAPRLRALCWYYLKISQPHTISMTRLHAYISSDEKHED